MSIISVLKQLFHIHDFKYITEVAGKAYISNWSAVKQPITIIISHCFACSTYKVSAYSGDINSEFEWYSLPKEVREEAQTIVNTIKNNKEAQR
jgi:hypothetical protein